MLPGGFSLSYWGHRLGGDGSGSLAQADVDPGLGSLLNRPSLSQGWKGLVRGVGGLSTVYQGVLCTKVPGYTANNRL